MWYALGDVVNDPRIGDGHPSEEDSPCSPTDGANADSASVSSVARVNPVQTAHRLHAVHMSGLDLSTLDHTRMQCSIACNDSRTHPSLSGVPVCTPETSCYARSSALPSSEWTRTIAYTEQGSRELNPASNDESIIEHYKHTNSSLTVRRPSRQGDIPACQS